MTMIWRRFASFLSANGTERYAELRSQCSLTEIRLKTVLSNSFREYSVVIYPRGGTTVIP